MFNFSHRLIATIFINWSLLKFSEALKHRWPHQKMYLLDFCRDIFWAGLGMFIVNQQYITAYLIHYISKDITLFCLNYELCPNAFHFQLRDLNQSPWHWIAWLTQLFPRKRLEGKWKWRIETHSLWSGTLLSGAARGEWTERTCWVFPVQYPDLLNGIISKMGILFSTLQSRCCPLAWCRTEARTQHFSSEPDPMLYRMMYVPCTFSSSAQSLNAYTDRLILAF